MHNDQLNLVDLTENLLQTIDDIPCIKADGKPQEYPGTRKTNAGSIPEEFQKDLATQSIGYRRYICQFKPTRQRSKGKRTTHVTLSESCTTCCPFSFSVRKFSGNYSMLSFKEQGAYHTCPEKFNHLLPLSKKDKLVLIKALLEMGSEKEVWLKVIEPK